MSGRLYRPEPTYGAHRPGAARTTRLAQQRARAEQLDAIRLERPLTNAEQAEADQLASRHYMRVWRQQMRERFGAAR